MMLLKLIFFTALGLGLAFLMQNDPGYALIAYGDTAYEMPLWFLLLIVVFGFLILHSVFNATGWLFQIPSSVKAWWHAKKLEKELQSIKDAVLATHEENWTQASRVFSNVSGVAAALGKAKALHHLQEYTKRDLAFTEAHRQFPEQDYPINFVKAQCAFEQKEFEQCEKMLKDLSTANPDHLGVLHARYALYKKSEAWAELEEILPLLKANRLLGRESFDRELAHSLELQAKKATDETSLRAIFDRVPKRLYGNPDLIFAFSEKYHQLGFDESCANLLKLGLAAPFSAKLLDLFGKIKHQEPQKSKKTLLAWQKKEPGNTDLLIALARISLACKEWGQARVYYEEALAKNPDTHVFYELALLVEHLGDRDEAHRLLKASYQKDVVLPIPLPPKKLFEKRSSGMQ